MSLPEIVCVVGTALIPTLYVTFLIKKRFNTVVTFIFAFLLTTLEYAILWKWVDYDKVNIFLYIIWAYCEFVVNLLVVMIFGTSRPLKNWYGILLFFYATNIVNNLFTMMTGNQVVMNKIKNHEIDLRSAVSYTISLVISLIICIIIFSLLSKLVNKLLKKIKKKTPFDIFGKSMFVIVMIANGFMIIQKYNNYFADKNDAGNTLTTKGIYFPYYVLCILITIVFLTTVIIYEHFLLGRFYKYYDKETLVNYMNKEFTAKTTISGSLAIDMVVDDFTENFEEKGIYFDNYIKIEESDSNLRIIYSAVIRNLLEIAEHILDEYEGDEKKWIQIEAGNTVRVNGKAVKDDGKAEKDDGKAVKDDGKAEKKSGAVAKEGSSNNRLVAQVELPDLDFDKINRKKEIKKRISELRKMAAMLNGDFEIIREDAGGNNSRIILKISA